MRMHIGIQNNVHRYYHILHIVNIKDVLRTTSETKCSMRVRVKSMQYPPISKWAIRNESELFFSRLHPPQRSELSIPSIPPFFSIMAAHTKTPFPSFLPSFLPSPPLAFLSLCLPHSLIKLSLSLFSFLSTHPPKKIDLGLASCVRSSLSFLPSTQCKSAFASTRHLCCIISTRTEKGGGRRKDPQKTNAANTKAEWRVKGKGGREEGKGGRIDTSGDLQACGGNTTTTTYVEVVVAHTSSLPPSPLLPPIAALNGRRWRRRKKVLVCLVGVVR